MSLPHYLFTMIAVTQLVTWTPIDGAGARAALFLPQDCFRPNLIRLERNSPHMSSELFIVFVSTIRCDYIVASTDNTFNSRLSGRLYIVSLALTFPQLTKAIQDSASIIEQSILRIMTRK